MNRLIFLALLMLMGGLGGCASDAIKNSEDPKIIYDEAEKRIKDADYIFATELIAEIKRRFPQSKYAVLAELSSADLEYAQENYLESATLYKNFLNLHPNHDRAPYSQHRLTLAYLNNTPENVARDQTTAAHAAKAAQDLKKKYGAFPEAKDADDLYFKARMKLAEKEAYVARFYEKKGVNDSALLRWKGLLIDYKDLEARPEASALFQSARDRVKVLDKVN